MALQVFDPKILAQKAKIPSLSVAKMYELLLKATVDTVGNNVYAWQHPKDKMVYISDNDINDYLEQALIMFEQATGELCTDDNSFYALSRAYDSVAKPLTGPLPTKYNEEAADMLSD